MGITLGICMKGTRHTTQQMGVGVSVKTRVMICGFCSGFCCRNPLLQNYVTHYILLFYYYYILLCKITLYQITVTLLYNKSLITIIEGCVILICISLNAVVLLPNTSYYGKISNYGIT